MFTLYYASITFYLTNIHKQIFFFRFKNKPNLTFDDVSIEPDQTFDLQKDCEGVIEYNPK